MGRRCGCCLTWRTCHSCSVLPTELLHLAWWTCCQYGTLHVCLVLSHPKPWVSLWPRAEQWIHHDPVVCCHPPSGWACLIALHMMSFKWLWRWCLGALLRHDSPCSPRAFTIFPHMHVCGSQALQPNRWATATLTASSESLSPTAVICCASQSPQWEVDTARVWLCRSRWRLWTKWWIVDLLPPSRPRPSGCGALVQQVWVSWSGLSVAT